ncbi:MAG: tryptophan synthase subunit alpha [Dehalococcoidia bacterium]
MTDRIREAIEAANAQGRIALLPFVTAGHPSPETTPDIVRAIVDAGADVVELGVPFSDPLAEGPTIQKSSFDALSRGVTPAACIDMATRIRESGVTVPLIFMGYYNPILSMGIGEFCRRSAAAGVDGLIVPDLPASEAGPLMDEADAAGLSVIPLLALTSTDRSVEQSCRRAGGFIYCVSVLGVTGARAQVSSRVRGLVEKVRSHTDLPVAVGFGISTPEHVAEVAGYADGAAVGSALVNAISDGPPETAAERAGKYVASLKPGTRAAKVAN